jgi:hypothetical protein
MLKITVPGALCVALFVAGCTPTYVAPRDGPMAQISLTRGALEDSEQAKLMVSDAQWSRRADISGGLLFTYDAPATIPAGAPIYMELQTLRYAGTTEIYCGAHFAFVPEAGHSYAVTPDTHGGRACTAAVTDKATGQSPASFTVLPVPAGWRPAD